MASYMKSLVVNLEFQQTSWTANFTVSRETYQALWSKLTPLQRLQASITGLELIGFFIAKVDQLSKSLEVLLQQRFSAFYSEVIDLAILNYLAKMLFSSYTLDLVRRHLHN